MKQQNCWLWSTKLPAFTHKDAEFRERREIGRKRGRRGRESEGERKTEERKREAGRERRVLSGTVRWKHSKNAAEQGIKGGG